MNALTLEQATQLRTALEIIGDDIGTVLQYVAAVMWREAEQAEKRVEKRAILRGEGSAVNTLVWVTRRRAIYMAMLAHAANQRDV